MLMTISEKNEFHWWNLFVYTIYQTWVINTQFCKYHGITIFIVFITTTDQWSQLIMAQYWSFLALACSECIHVIMSVEDWPWTQEQVTPDTRCHTWCHYCNDQNWPVEASWSWPNYHCYKMICFVMKHECWLPPSRNLALDWLSKTESMPRRHLRGG